jgi:hypothetical protein
MGCNCKANEEILKIHKQYGHAIGSPWKERVQFRLEEGFKYILLCLLCILCFPLILILTIFFLAKGSGSINVNKLIRFLLRKDYDE